MKRIKREERVFQAICELSQEHDWSNAQEVAAYLGMDRANISKDLNILERMGRLRKLPGRPVRFCLPEKAAMLAQSAAAPSTPEPFDHMIGQDGSLTVHVKQAKAAVLYPPRGLNTILTGPTGTGKTTFAREMYEYARHMKTISEKASFVVLNCAEYVKNPQLLVSQLFGHKKGAFTGAESDKVGLVEKADGGILLLDEIHCLPPEGQEMLFTLIDSGSYRRLGETEQNRTADVLLIGATTEDIEASLLKTFLRRIPVVITLPPLTERPPIERLEFIDMFFQMEQENIGVPLAVSREVIGRLMEYSCPGNVGQLKADIQLLCAGAFWQSRDAGRRVVELGVDSLTLEMKHSAGQDPEMWNVASMVLKQLPQRLVWGGTCYEGAGGILGRSGVLADTISYLRRKARQDVVKESADLTREVRRYMDRAERAAARGEGALPALPASAAILISFAEFRLGRALSQRAARGLRLYLEERCRQPGAVEHLSARQLAELSERYKEEYSLAQLFQLGMEEELHLRLENYDVALLTIFLCADIEAMRPKVGVVVLAHGESTARSMATAANEILHCNHCCGLDIPVDTGMDSDMVALREIISQADQGEGILFLVDMSPLEDTVHQIAEESGVRAEVVCITSTPVVVEAVRLANAGGSLEEVTGKLKGLIREMLHGGDQEKTSRLPLLLVNCPAQKKAVKSVSEMLNAIMDIRTRASVEIRALDCEVELLRPEEFERVLAVVGTEAPSSPEIPFISVDELVIGNGIRRLEALLGHSGEDEGEPEESVAIAPSVLTHVLKEVLSFLDAEKVRPMIVDALLCCQSYWQQQAVDKGCVTELGMRYVIHVACMLERLLKQDILPYNEVAAAKDAKRELFQTAKRSVKEMETFFRLEVPDTELAYLVEILGSAQRES